MADSEWGYITLCRLAAWRGSRRFQAGFLVPDLLCRISWIFRLSNGLAGENRDLSWK